MGCRHCKMMVFGEILLTDGKAHVSNVRKQRLLKKNIPVFQSNDNIIL